MKIRAVTLFSEGNKDLAILPQLDAAIQKASRELKLEVLTKRVTFPYMDEKRIDVSSIDSMMNKMGYAYSALAVKGSIDPSIFVKLMASTKSYGSILIDEADKAPLITEVLRRMDSSISRRFAALIGNELETPYYPASVNVRGGMGIALAILYPSDLIGARSVNDIRNRLEMLLRKAEEFGHLVADSISVEYRGLDASLSPWGWESTVDVLEQFGSRIGSPGFMKTIWDINRELMALSVKKLGFNEVMLPLAEDERLKERARAGFITFKDLVTYSSVCVAGVDMVPIPMNDIDHVAGVVADLYAVSQVKKRPIGLRLIPSVKETGDVDIEGFGETPVLRVNQ
ncbi:MAG: DUF711 family protein [Thermocladium sp.]|jgi:uncharacterized protein (UPF0210 family)